MYTYIYAPDAYENHKLAEILANVPAGTAAAYKAFQDTEPKVDQYTEGGTDAWHRWYDKKTDAIHQFEDFLNRGFGEPRNASVKGILQRNNYTGEELGNDPHELGEIEKGRYFVGHTTDQDEITRLLLAQNVKLNRKIRAQITGISWG